MGSVLTSSQLFQYKSTLLHSDIKANKQYFSADCLHLWSMRFVRITPKPVYSDISVNHISSEKQKKHSFRTEETNKTIEKNQEAQKC